MQFQLRHLFLGLAVTALVVQAYLLIVSPDSARGGNQDRWSLNFQIWLAGVIATAGIFSSLLRPLVRMLALGVLAYGLGKDHGTESIAGLIAVGFCVAAICWHVALLSNSLSSTAFWCTLSLLTAPVAICCAMIWHDWQTLPVLPRAAYNRLWSVQSALENYKEHHGSYPPAFVCDSSGKRLHSWRALILPFSHDITSLSIAHNYRFNEPWDSPHNRLMANQAPWEYSPADWHNDRDGRTCCFAAIGPLREPLGHNAATGQVPESHRTRHVLMCEKTIPYWSEPVDFEFSLDGSTASPWPEAPSSPREPCLVRGEAGFVRLPATPAETTEWLNFLTTNLERETFPPLRADPTGRHFSTLAWHPAPQPKYAKYWLALAAYVLIEVLISFALAPRSRRNDPPLTMEEARDAFTKRHLAQLFGRRKRARI